MSLLLWQFVVPAEAATDPFLYATTVVRKGLGCDYDPLYTVGKIDAKLDAPGQPTGAVTASWVPTHLVITNKSTNKFYFISSAVQDSAASPNAYVTANPGVSYFKLVPDNAPPTYRSSQPSYTIPFKIAFLPGTTGTGGSGGTGGGSGGTTNLTSDLHIVRPYWTTSGNTITITAAQIINRSASVRSGDLSVNVIATATPFNGSSQSAYTMGYLTRTALPAAYHYDNVYQSTAYTRPPKGRWYTAVVLQEYNASLRKYVARDWLAFGYTDFK